MSELNKQAKYPGPKRQDRLLRELDHDPYHAKKKMKTPAVCPVCGAVYLSGRWTWMSPPTDARPCLCPACQRIEDRVPAAFLTLRGDFVNSRRDEIMKLINNYAERQRKEHPLKRIMGQEDKEDSVLFMFTDAHLARGIGEALHNAYEGELSYQYTKEDIMLRVTWER